MDRHTDTKTDRQMDGHRQTDIQIDTHTHTDRQTDRWTYVVLSATSPSKAEHPH